MKFGFARAQIIGAGYRSHDTKICCAQYFSKSFPEQNAFPNENDRKGRLPQHSGAPCTGNQLGDRCHVPCGPYTENGAQYPGQVYSEVNTPLPSTQAESPERIFRKLGGDSAQEGVAIKLLEIANSVEAVQDGRIHIEKINGPFLKVGSAAEYGGGLANAIARGWLWKHETREKTLGLGWKRLGRPLGFLHGDFAGVPSVEGFPCSETLRKRYGLKVRKARKRTA
jgi:hypothetical protein